MSSSEAGAHRLAPRAFDDLEDIWRYMAETWSIAQADRYIDEISRVFDVLADMPTLARERPEFNPPVRIHVHQKHLIVYTLGADHVSILRVLGARQDWASILSATES